MPAPSATPATPASLQLALSRHARQWHGADGAGYVELIGWDVSKRLADPVRLTWRGDQASAFWSAHQQDLRAGRVLYIGHGPLHARDSHFEARVTSRTLAPLPPSWLKHAESSEQAQPSHGASATHHQPTTETQACQPSTS